MIGAAVAMATAAPSADATLDADADGAAVCSLSSAGASVTQAGTASGPDGNPITNIKLPHVGGHEGVGRIVALGPGCGEDVKIGSLVGIRFASRICRRCEFCLAGTEQYCIKSTNHLHHGSSQLVVIDEFLSSKKCYRCYPLAGIALQL